MPVHSLMCCNDGSSSTYLIGATLEYPFRMALERLSQHEEPTTTCTEPLYRPQQGCCTSINLNVQTQHYMASFRFPPSLVAEMRPRSTMHYIAEACPSSEMEETIVSTFDGPSHQIFLSRSLLFSSPIMSSELFSSPRQLAAISDESTCSLAVYDVTEMIASSCTSPVLFQRLPAANSNNSQYPRGILDSCHFVHPYYGDFLSIITSESLLLLHRWYPHVS